MSEIEDWMVPQSERQLTERRDNELRAAIRAALEAAAKMLRETSNGYSALVKRCDKRGDVHSADQYADEAAVYESAAIAIAKMSPDDILKGMK